MNQSTLITDNITEILIKVIEFTQRRQKVLIANINNVYSAGYAPKDLQVDEFSDCLTIAVDEHVRTGWLVLRDGKNTKFGVNGNFVATPVIDEEARKLLQSDTDEYLQMQISKLVENALNQRMATDLLEQKQGIVSIYE